MEHISKSIARNMADLLILYVCLNCGEEHYFEPDELPGGNEHCEYCEHCTEKLTEI